MESKKLTTTSGRSYPKNEDSMTVGPRDQILLQDYYLHWKLSHVNREGIPDGFMTVDGNNGASPNYYPNSFHGIVADKSYKDLALKIAKGLGINFKV